MECVRSVFRIAIRPTEEDVRLQATMTYQEFCLFDSPIPLAASLLVGCRSRLLRYKFGLRRQFKSAILALTILT